MRQRDRDGERGRESERGTEIIKAHKSTAADCADSEVQTDQENPPTGLSDEIR